MAVIAEAAVNFPTAGDMSGTVSRWTSDRFENSCNEYYKFSYVLMWEIIQDIYKVNDFGKLSISSLRVELEAFKREEKEIKIPGRKYLDPLLAGGNISQGLVREYHEKGAKRLSTTKITPPKVLDALKKWESLQYVKYEQSKDDKLRGVRKGASMVLKVSAALGGAAGLDSLFGD